MCGARRRLAPLDIHEHVRADSLAGLDVLLATWGYTRSLSLIRADEEIAYIDFLRNRPNLDVNYTLSRWAGLTEDWCIPPIEEHYGMIAKEVAQLERYESRAISRRREAVRQFQLALLGIDTIE